MFKSFLILLTIRYVDSKMEGYVVGGETTNINKYPHAVFLDISSEYTCICGGSILNQDIVLSAAHCFDEYKGRVKDQVTIKYGSSIVASMSMTIMRFYRLHDHYNEFTMYGDLSLLVCKTPIMLGKLVKRVAIMETPPKEKLAYVSGWGTINSKNDLPKKIKHTKQNLHTSRVCEKYLSLPAGTFCAGPIKGEGHPAVGDSGGGLILKKYIQIGVVSFKEDEFSLVVYTNVSYHYTWIQSNAAYIYCAKKKIDKS